MPGLGVSRQDWKLLQLDCLRFLLLIGNQGVGKNKLADRLLQLLRCEREYIQLHRDTTVQALTSSPTLRGGVIVLEDSPLVRAAREPARGTTADGRGGTPGHPRAPVGTP